MLNHIFFVHTKILFIIFYIKFRNFHFISIYQTYPRTINRVHFCNPRSRFEFLRNPLFHFKLNHRPICLLFPAKNQGLANYRKSYTAGINDFRDCVRNFAKILGPRAHTHAQYMSKRGSLAENSAKPVSIGFIPTIAW